MNRWRTLRTPACTLLVAELVLYFAYPVWDLFDVSRAAALAIGFAHLLVLGAALWWWTGGTASPPVPVPRRATWSALRSWPGAVLGVALLTAAAIQLPIMTWPLLSGPDEPVLVDEVLVQRMYLAESPVWATLGAFACVLGLAVIGVATLARRLPTRGAAIAGAAVAAVACVAGYAFFESATSEPWGQSRRWPPLGTVLPLMSHAVLGENTIAARLPSLAFFLLTAIYVYRIAAAEIGRWPALAASVMCLAMPTLFNQGHLATRETGGALMLTAGVFYLLRHVRTGSAYDIGMCAVAVVLGYLERRPVALLVFIAPGTLLLCRLLAPTRTNLLRGAAALRVYGGALAAIVLTVLPWQYLTRDVRSFSVHPENWDDWNIVLAYVKRLPHTVGWPGTALLAVGAVVGAIRRRPLEIAAVLWIVLTYGLFTSDKPHWIPTDRFVALVCPAIAVLAVRVLATGTRRGRRVAVFASVGVALLGIGPLAGWLTGANVAWTRPPGADGLAQQPHYPFDEMAEAIASDGVTDVTFAPPVFWQTGLRPHLRMIGHGGRVRERMPAWTVEREIPLAGATIGARLNRIDYLMVPLADPPTGTPRFITDLTAEQIAADDVTGFEVVGTWWRGEHGLALLRVRRPPSPPRPDPAR
jgi:hypothetical protein